VAVCVGRILDRAVLVRDRTQPATGGCSARGSFSAAVSTLGVERYDQGRGVLGATRARNPAKPELFAPVIAMDTSPWLGKTVMGSRSISALAVALALAACAPFSTQTGSREGVGVAQRGGGARPLFEQTGDASWFSNAVEGSKGASGERIDPDQRVAGHLTLPVGSVVRVTRLDNDRSVVVEIVDRGPTAPGRVIDLSRRAAQELSMVEGHGSGQGRSLRLGSAEQAEQAGHAGSSLGSGPAVRPVGQCLGLRDRKGIAAPCDS
jgi:rare lipoprotein A